jgi:hypothetical protein
MGNRFAALRPTAASICRHRLDAAALSLDVIIDLARSCSLFVSGVPLR